MRYAILTIAAVLVGVPAAAFQSADLVLKCEGTKSAIGGLTPRQESTATIIRFRPSVPVSADKTGPRPFELVRDIAGESPLAAAANWCYDECEVTYTKQAITHSSDRSGLVLSFSLSRSTGEYTATSKIEGLGGESERGRCLAVSATPTTEPRFNLSPSTDSLSQNDKRALVQYYRAERTCISMAAIKYRELRSGDISIFLDVVGSECRKEDSLAPLQRADSSPAELSDVGGFLSGCAMVKALANVNYLPALLDEARPKQCTLVLSELGGEY